MKSLQKQRYVYFLRSTCSEGRIKIGCSYKPINRLLALSVWGAYPLEVVAVAPGDFSTERALHEYFAADRLHREWFRSSPELLAVIDAMAHGVSVSDALLSVAIRRAA